MTAGNKGRQVLQKSAFPTHFTRLYRFIRPLPRLPLGLKQSIESFMRLSVAVLAVIYTERFSQLILL